MKIGLISDTHGFINRQIELALSECDEIWHAGDIGKLDVIHRLSQICPVKAVYGNIDNNEIRAEFSEDLIIDQVGCKVVITHIGGRPGKYSKRARQLIDTYHPDIFICGHSHILKVIRDKQYNLLYINPGAAGQQGMHKIRTLIRFEIDNGKIQSLEVVELGKRGR